MSWKNLLHSTWNITLGSLLWYQSSGPPVGNSAAWEASVLYSASIITVLYSRNCIHLWSGGSEICTRILALTSWLARKYCVQTRSVRAQGSCALDLCAVACGRVDFMYEIGFGGCWDCAAGALVAREAGGIVLDPSGGPFNVMSRRVLAGNQFVTKKAAEVLAAQPLGPQEPPVMPSLQQ